LADAPVDIFAVGTELALSPDAPSLGIVYKVVYDEDNNRPLVKVSPGKTTLPGRKQVFLDTRDNGWSHLIALEGVVQSTPKLTPLMDCYISNGDPVNKGVSLALARTYCNSCLVNLHENLAGFMAITLVIYPILRRHTIYGAMAVMACWELVEVVIAKHSTFPLAGHEEWINKVVGDPISNFLGFFLAIAIIKHIEWECKNEQRQSQTGVEEEQSSTKEDDSRAN